MADFLKSVWIPVIFPHKIEAFRVRNFGAMSLFFETIYTSIIKGEIHLLAITYAESIKFLPNLF